MSTRWTEAYNFLRFWGSILQAILVIAFLSWGAYMIFGG